MTSSRTRARPLLLIVGADGTSAFGTTFEVFHARDAAHAASQLAKLQPDVVLAAASLPPAEAIAMCKHLRGELGAADVPLVLVVDSYDPTTIDEAQHAGVTDFVMTGTGQDLLEHRLRYLLRAATTLRETRASATNLARAQRLARLAQWELVLETGRFRWSDVVTSIFGIPAETPESGLEAILRWVHADDRLAVARTMLDASPHRIEYRLALPDGRVRMIHQEAEIVVDSDGEPIRIIGAAQDVTELREAERQVMDLAYFDNLTRLPNRALLRRFLDRSVKDAVESARSLAVLAIDLDGFKRVNDSLGHAAGDALLREVAARLTRSVRGARLHEGPSDGLSFEQHLVAGSMVARLGGDEFVVVLTDLRRPEDAASVARRVGDAVCASFAIANSEVFVSASIGIACLPDSGTDVDDLLEHADAAMYHAKERGRNNFQFYTPGLYEKARHRMAIESSLRAAMARVGILPGVSSPAPGAEHELFLAFQPKVEVPSGRMAGAEALLRWKSRELGFVPPSDFIPIAEDTGLIVPLGDWVLEQACLQSVKWIARGMTGVRIAVNVSARQFREADFCARASEIIRRTGVRPELLELEITEGVVMQDTAGSSKILEELKALGVRIALDDFGTGYSSLSYLTKLPIDALKIDRSFIGGVDSAGKGATITSAIIALSKGLSIDVVVEGVETEEQLDFVAQHGQAEIQGFLFAKPMSAAQLADWSPPALAPDSDDVEPESGIFRLEPTGT